MKYTTHEEIDKSYCLTEWQKEIEHIILDKELDVDFADTLRLLSSFANEIQSTQHYQRTHYRTSLLEQAKELFNRLS